MLRDIELAFIRLHILYHADHEEIFGVGLIEELARHGYALGPGTLYPTLAKMEEAGWLASKLRTVEGKQRKYYRITPTGKEILAGLRQKLEEVYAEVMT